MKITKRKAGRDLYETGLFIPDESRKTGFRHDRSKPSDEHDKVVAKKGEYYYMWSLYGDKKPRISTTYPTRDKLTKSTFKLAIYSIEDLFNSLIPGDSFIYSLQTAMGKLEQLNQELIYKLNNMPPQFQNSKPRILLKKRSIFVSNWIYRVEKVTGKYNMKAVDQQVVLIDKLKEIISSNDSYV